MERYRHAHHCGGKNKVEELGRAIGWIQHG
jgi:hypothetical protein